MIKYIIYLSLLGFQVEAHAHKAQDTASIVSATPSPIAADAATLKARGLAAKKQKAIKKTRKKAAQERGKTEGLNNTITHKQHGHAHITDTPETARDARAAINKIARQREEIEEHTAWQIKAILDVIDTKKVARLPANTLAQNIGVYKGMSGFLSQIAHHQYSPKSLKKDIKSKYLPRIQRIIKIAEQGTAKHASPPDIFEHIKKIEALKTPIPSEDEDMKSLLKEWDQERQSLYLVQELAVKEFLSLIVLMPNDYIEDTLPQKLTSKSFTVDILQNMDDRYKKVFAFLNGMLAHPDITESTRRSVTAAVFRLKRLHRIIMPVIRAKQD